MALGQVVGVALVLTWVTGICCGYQAMDTAPSAITHQHLKKVFLPPGEMRRLQETEQLYKYDKKGWLHVLDEAGIETEENEDIEKDQRKDPEVPLPVHRSNPVPPVIAPHLEFLMGIRDSISSQNMDEEP